jgi:hypothetical protein
VQEVEQLGKRFQFLHPGPSPTAKPQ